MLTFLSCADKGFFHSVEKIPETDSSLGIRQAGWGEPGSSASRPLVVVPLQSVLPAEEEVEEEEENPLV